MLAGVRTGAARPTRHSQEYIGTDPSEPRGTGCCLDQQKNTSLRGRYTGGSGTWASPPSLPQVPESIARHDSPSAGAATLTEDSREVTCTATHCGYWTPAKVKHGTLFLAQVLLSFEI
ncbi:uncharacterized protein LOC135107889 isoform X2 [Scylla paramamosain]|uniref:uncharacterized protein LOC135107889 isoform X2 n=1 Tax=Scylla paramamosain TaxID=85552 RepID=UPI003083ADBE